MTDRNTSAPEPDVSGFPLALLATRFLVPVGDLRLTLNADGPKALRLAIDGIIAGGLDLEQPVKGLLGLICVLEHERSSADTARTMFEILASYPEIVGLFAERAETSFRDVRRFAQSLGAELLAAAPRIDEPAPEGSVSVRQFLDATRERGRRPPELGNAVTKPLPPRRPSSTTTARPRRGALIPPGKSDQTSS